MAMAKMMLCVRCELRLSGVGAEEVCSRTKDTGGGGECRACFGLLREGFVRDAVTRVANMLVDQGYAGQQDEDGDEDGGEDEEDDDVERNDKVKRVRVDGCTSSGSIDELEKLQQLQQQQQQQKKKMKRGFCVEVKTFEAAAATVAQRVALHEMAMTRGDDVEELVMKAVDLKPVFKSLMASMLPQALRDICAQRWSTSPSMSMSSSSSQLHHHPEFVFDSEAPLKVGVSLVYTRDASVMAMIKSTYRSAEKEAQAAEAKAATSDTVAGDVREGNGNAAATTSQKARNKGNAKSKLKTLLPQKKRENFLSHHRPPLPILASALEILPPSSLAELKASLASLPTPTKDIRCDLKVHRTSVYCYGRYIKRQRGLSQTPWILNDVVMGDGSVEECIVPIIAKTLGAESHSFISSGREDIDVRMLGDGRPFAVELKNPKRYLHLSPDDRVATAGQQQQKQQQSGTNGSGPEHTRANEMAALNARVETMINSKEVNTANRGRVVVKDLEFFCSEKTLNAVKNAGEGKQKCYRALIWSSRKFTKADYDRINALNDVKVQQNTPIRVLHRRSPLIREKIIHEMRLEPVVGNGSTGRSGDGVEDGSWNCGGDSHFAIINMRTSAGTYIKEFVHGDLGRTKPSLGTLLGSNSDSDSKDISVQILQLDVSEVVVA